MSLFNYNLRNTEFQCPWGDRRF